MFDQAGPLKPILKPDWRGTELVFNHTFPLEIDFALPQALRVPESEKGVGLLFQRIFPRIWLTVA
jgi:hypothetical protein